MRTSARSGVVVFFVAFALASEARQAFGQADPVIGTWVMDRAKSSFTPGPPPQSRTLRFEAAGDGLKHTTDSIDGEGGTVTVVYTAKYDGRDYPIVGSALDTVALRRIDARTVERTGKVRGQAVETFRRTLSADRKVLTITTKGSIDGTDYSSVQVFDRQ